MIVRSNHEKEDQCFSFLDDNIAQVLAALDASGQRDNTQIVYTSDHGDMISEHAHSNKGKHYGKTA